MAKHFLVQTQPFSGVILEGSSPNAAFGIALLPVKP